MKSYLMILSLLTVSSCNSSAKLSKWDKECLEEPFRLLMAANGQNVPAYEGIKRNKVFIWDESDSLFRKLKELQSSNGYNEEKEKIFTTGTGSDIVRLEGRTGDKARDIVRESTFYKACVNFLDVNLKKCSDCKLYSLIYFRWNVSDFSNMTGSSVVDFRKFKEPEFEMQFKQRINPFPDL